MKILLKNTIDTLKQLKMEMHDVMDSSTQAKLDQVIQDLEQHNDLTGLGATGCFLLFYDKELDNEYW